MHLISKNQKMKLLIFIPARQGSKGIKNKNFAKLNGKPLIDYTLRFAEKLTKKYNNFSIFFSTDSAKYLKYARTRGMKFEYLRPKSLSSDKSNIIDAIFHGYSNKVHDGFLGNSYIGEWVNLGANTNNSNLKNNYGKIKFQFNNQILETNKLFLGTMIGDFTRTGISTMINTGSNIGLGSNIFGGGFQNKYINSFSWGEKDIVDFNKFIETVKIMKDRRNEKISKTEVSFLKKIYYKNTK